MAHVTKRFGALKVLDDLTFRVEPGEVVGLIGANGAGKTTLLRIAAGLMTADTGIVCRPTASRAIRYFGGERTLPPDVRLDRWSALFGMRCRDRRRMGQLSRGNRQLFGLRVTLGGPLAGLVLLDEPWKAWIPRAAPGSLAHSRNGRRPVPPCSSRPIACTISMPRALASCSFAAVAATTSPPIRGRRFSRISSPSAQGKRSDYLCGCAIRGLAGGHLRMVGYRAAPSASLAGHADRRRRLCGRNRTADGDCRVC